MLFLYVITKRKVSESRNDGRLVNSKNLFPIYLTDKQDSGMPQMRWKDQFLT
jgi:hypothetical protein